MVLGSDKERQHPRIGSRIPFRLGGYGADGEKYYCYYHVDYSDGGSGNRELQKISPLVEEAMMWKGTEAAAVE